MRVAVRPSLNQVRWHVNAALGCFETLRGETAACQCQAELQALLEYLDILDSADDAVVLTASRVEAGVRLEGAGCDFEPVDSVNVEIVPIPSR